MKEGWEYKKLGEVCETSSGGTPSKSHMEYYEGGTIPWLRSGEVAQGLIYDTELCITDLGMRNSSAKLFPVDTVVIAMYGATVGQVGVLKKVMTTNQAICGVFPNKNLYPMFLLYCLKAKKPFFIKDAVGGAQPNISQNLIKNTIVPVPPISEQQQIVEELDLLSSIIEKKKAQLNELDNLAQSLFYEMFGDPITNEHNYQVFKLGDICSTITKGTTPTSVGFSFIDEGINFIKVESFDRDESFNPQRVAHISIECNEVLKRSILEENDILMCIAGATCGRLAIVPKDALPANTNQAFAIIRLKEKERELLSYVYSYLHSQYIKNLVNELMKGVAQPNLTLAHLRNFNIIMPPTSLLNLYASKTESINHQKELIKQSIKEVETLFNSRMDYYFN